MDTGVDAGVDSRWLSYAELAELRHIDKPSALKLAIRHKWPRRKDNHGRMQVCVPLEWVEPQDKATDRDVDLSMHLSTALAAYEDAKAAFAEALKQAESRADQDRQRADRAEKALDGERARADALRDRLQVAQADVQQARQATEALRQAEADRKARGRLRRVWDGWRGR